MSHPSVASISFTDAICKKVNLSMFISLIIFIIVLSYPAQSLQPMIENLMESLDGDFFYDSLDSLE
jgi:Na+-transporting NADH:ubiquinone oxidoreductase subunit NqrE